MEQDDKIQDDYQRIMENMNKDTRKNDQKKATRTRIAFSFSTIGT